MRNNRTITNRRHQKARSLVVLLSAILLAPGPVLPQKQRENRTALTKDQRIVHLLNRIAFGARPGDVEHVKAMGIENYIEQQLAPDRIPDPNVEAKVKHLATLNMSTAELYEKFPQPGQLIRELQRQGLLPQELAEARREPGSNSSTEMQRSPDSPNPMDNEKVRRAIREYYEKNGLQLPQRIMAELHASRILRAVYSERQLQEVMVDFWTNHFNVFAGKGADRWLLTAYDRDTIRPHAVGKFSELLLATAKSPAMLFYLDNFQSVSPNIQARRGMGQRRGIQQRDPIFRPGAPNGRNNEMERPQPQMARRGLNENYARELMELHTLGVDGGYTQKDVQEVARCFTGWTILAPRGGGAAPSGLLGAVARKNAGTFFFNERVHDDGEKTVLGHKISSGGGINDGLRVLEILARHPSTAKFIASKLVVHFVSDEPPAALVDRVAATYAKSGGDIREMLRTILYSAEFNSPVAYRAKIKRPFELAVSALRTLGAETNGGPQLHQWIARMGEPLYGFQAPTGYSDTAESWVTTGGLLERMNFGLALASNRVPGTRVNLKGLIDNPEDEQGGIMDDLLQAILAGEISQNTRAALMKQLNQQPPANSASLEETPASGQLNRAMAGPRRQTVRAGNNDPVTKMVGLILGSPEFQRQ